MQGCQAQPKLEPNPPQQGSAGLSRAYESIGCITMVYDTLKGCIIVCTVRCKKGQSTIQDTRMLNVEEWLPARSDAVRMPRQGGNE